MIVGIVRARRPLAELLIHLVSQQHSLLRGGDPDSNLLERLSAFSMSHLGGHDGQERSMQQARHDHSDRPVRFSIGDEVLVIDSRYETASIVNDVLIALWFTIGSALFFSEPTQVAGTWMFLIGSIQFLIRPVIRLGRRIHLRRLGSDAGHRAADYDY
jgi:hypothetical protein